MPASDHADRLTRDLFDFARQLHASGVRTAIMSPGSRSTPLTMAFSALPDLQHHVVLDERSAAFMALAHGKVTGRPAALICTSGTAAANYFPAVVEARSSGAPLLLLTADRPPLLRELGASQTIDQLKLYGDFAVFFHEVGEWQDTERDRKRLMLLAGQAVQASMEAGGPAHLNFPLRKPLEPSNELVNRLASEPHDQHLPVTRHVIDGSTGAPYYAGEADAGQTPGGKQHVRQLLERHRRRLLVIGGMPAYAPPPGRLLAWAQAHNCPVLAEPASQLNPAAAAQGGHPGGAEVIITGGDVFLRDENRLRQLAPELILRVGRHPLGNGLHRLLEHAGEAIQILFQPPGRWDDPSLSADYRLPLHHAWQLPDAPAGPDQWLQAWQQAATGYHRALASLLDETEALTDPAVFHDLVPAIEPDRSVVLSNSFPVRDFDQFAFHRKTTQPVLVNRGAGGIDGLTSTAIGVCQARGADAVLFTGDLAFLHDTNALMAAATLEANLTVVVINNGGGTIFRMLPFESHDHRFTRYFETPQSVDTAMLCKAYGAGHRVVDRREDLLPAYRDLSARKGLHVLECRTDAGASMAVRKQLWNRPVP